MASPQQLSNEITDFQIDELRHKTISHKERWLSVFVASIGNQLEYQNFTVFGLLGDEIGRNFFPGSNEAVQILNAFALFAGAFFMRPVGAVLFGYIGDKYSRILALRISIFIMGIATFGMGCLPTYASIGITAPILLTIFRLIQGLSSGGEYAGAITYTLELSLQKQLAFYNVMPAATADFGIFIGTIFVGVLRTLCSHRALHTFGWRIPFLFGVISAAVALWMRSGLHHSVEFMMKKEAGSTVDNPVGQVLKNHKWSAFTVITFSALRAGTFYAYWIWFPEYINNKSTNHVDSVYLISGVNLVIKICVMVISAHLVDRYLNSKPAMILIIFGIIESVYAVVVFSFCDKIIEMDIVMVLFVQMGFAIIDGIYTCGCDLWAVLRFGNNTVIRYSGIGIAYNTAFALFGGTAPLIASALVLKYDTWTLGLWMCCYGLMSVSTNVICYFCIDVKSQSVEMMGSLSEVQRLEQH